VVENAAIVAGELVSVSLRKSRTPIVFEVRLHEDSIEVRVRDHVSIQSSLLEASDVGTRRSGDLIRRLCRTWGMRLTESERLLWAVIELAPDEALTPTTASPARADLRET
jgi:hypothetical protein